jgi:hypothetical protein
MCEGAVGTVVTSHGMPVGWGHPLELDTMDTGMAEEQLAEEEPVEKEEEEEEEEEGSGRGVSGCGTENHTS